MAFVVARCDDDSNFVFPNLGKGEKSSFAPPSGSVPDTEQALCPLLKCREDDCPTVAVGVTSSKDHRRSSVV